MSVIEFLNLMKPMPSPIKQLLQLHETHGLAGQTAYCIGELS